MTISSILAKSFQVSALAAAVALVGCGGGSGGNDTLLPPISKNPTDPSTDTDDTAQKNIAKVASVHMVGDGKFYLQKDQKNAGGGQNNNNVQVTLTVHALDTKNQGVADVPVSVTIPNPKDTGVLNNSVSDLKTDEKGQAIITLTVNLSDLTDEQKTQLINGIDITAKVGNQESKKTIQGVDSKPPSSTPTNIEADLGKSLITTSNATIAHKTGTTVTVTAIILDKNGSPIPNKPVTFNLNKHIGLVANDSNTVNTNDKGEAKLEFEIKSLSPELKNGVSIGAKVDGKNFNETITIKTVDPKIASEQKFDVRKVSLTTPDAQQQFNVKVGEKITVTASVLNAKNTGIGGVPVQFELEDPTLTGVYAISDTNQVLTNANGEATIELEVKSEKHKQRLLDNRIRITATANNTMGDEPQTIRGMLELQGIQADTNSPSANINKVKKVGLHSPTPTFDIELDKIIEVTASVADTNGGSLANVPVTFTVPEFNEFGIINLSGSTVKTDSSGNATIRLQIKSLGSDKRKKLEAGITINATVPNGTPIQPYTLKAKKTSKKPVTSISVVADSNTILMSKGSKVLVTAIALDDDKGGVANQRLTFKVTDPALTGVFNTTGSTVTTNEKGEATITLEIKSDLTPAQQKRLLGSQNGSESGVKITVSAANSQGVSNGQLTLKGKKVNHADVSSVTLTSTTRSIPLTIGHRFFVTARVADDKNGGIANAAVTFTLPSLKDTGIISRSPSTITTDNNGNAQIEFEVVDVKNIRSYIINASSNGTQANALQLSVDTVDKIDKVELTTDITTLNIEPDAVITATAKVYDNKGNALANMPVTFNDNSSGLIKLTPLSTKTNAQGEATLKLKVGALTPGQKYQLKTHGLTLTATTGNKNTKVTLKTQEGIAADAIKTLILSPDAIMKLTKDAKVNVTATALDEFGAAVPNAQVRFELGNNTGLANNTGSIVTTNEKGQATIEIAIADLTKAKQALQANRVQVKAYPAISNSTVTGSTTIRSKNSQENKLYKLFVSPSKQTMTTAFDTATLTIRVTDKNGGIIANAPVQLQMVEGIDKGLSFSKPSNLRTDENGLVTVDLIQSDTGLAAKLNHTAKIKVIVNDGEHDEESQEMEFNIQGTQIITPTVSKTSVKDSDEVTFEGKLVTGQVINNAATPIANTTVELVNMNAPDTVIATAITDAQGKYHIQKMVSGLGTAVKDKLNLAIRVRDTQTKAKQTFDNLYTLTKITAQNVTMSIKQDGKDAVNNEVLTNQGKAKKQPATITLNFPKSLNGQSVYVSTTKGTLTYKNINNKNINVEGTRGLVRIENGKAEIKIDSDAPGDAVITVTEQDDGTTLLSETMTFVSKDVQSLTLTSDITLVNPNGEATITATVQDGQNRPIKNAIVEFSLISDASGGHIGSSHAITDDSGQVHISYFAGKVPTADNGVTIRSTVKAVRVGGKEEPVSKQLREISLTVQNQASFIGISLSDKVSTLENIYYYRDASVYVTNSFGKPAANQIVSITISPDYYRGGMYVPESIHQGPDKEDKIEWKLKFFPHYQDFENMILGNVKLEGASESQITCKAEDTNNNGKLDKGEDTNDNGKLDPHNPVTILSHNATSLEANGTKELRTDATGKLDFKIRYPKDTAQWFTAKIVVSTKVGGTESKTQLNRVEFPISAGDVTDEFRPNKRSPFAYRNVIKVQNDICMPPKK